MATLELECECGKVTGQAHDISPKTGMHIVCYCDDCQAFARALKQENPALDEHSGTDIFQTSSANITLQAGREHVKCLRLTAKGMYRWYTDCCKTPIGNTVGAKVPFIGLVTNFIKETNEKTEALGPVTSQILTQFATPALPDTMKIQSSRFIGNLRILFKFIKWKVRDGAKPTAFFNKDGTPVAKPTILSNSNVTKAD